MNILKLEMSSLINIVPSCDTKKIKGHFRRLPRFLPAPTCILSFSLLPALFCDVFFLDSLNAKVLSAEQLDSFELFSL